MTRTTILNPVNSAGEELLTLGTLPVASTIQSGLVQLSSSLGGSTGNLVYGVTDVDTLLSAKSSTDSPTFTGTVSFQGGPIDLPTGSTIGSTAILAAGKLPTARDSDLGVVYLSSDNVFPWINATGIMPEDSYKASSVGANARWLTTSAHVNGTFILPLNVDVLHVSGAAFIVGEYFDIKTYFIDCSATDGVGITIDIDLLVPHAYASADVSDCPETLTLLCRGVQDAIHDYPNPPSLLLTEFTYELCLRVQDKQLVIPASISWSCCKNKTRVYWLVNGELSIYLNRPPVLEEGFDHYIAVRVVSGYGGSDAYALAELVIKVPILSTIV